MVATDGTRRALDQARRPRVAKPADERRRELLTAATELFREHGYDATSVQAIAARAGVAAGTVYLHFAGKEAVLTAIADDFEAGLLERFGEIAEEVVAEEVADGSTVTPQEVVDRLVDGLVAYACAHRAACEVLTRHGASGGVGSGGALAEVLARVVREGVSLGHVHTADPEMASRLLTVAALTVIGQALTADDESLLDRTVRAVKELYVKALAPDPV